MRGKPWMVAATVLLAGNVCAQDVVRQAPHAGEIAGRYDVQCVWGQDTIGQLPTTNPGKPPSLLPDPTEPQRPTMLPDYNPPPVSPCQVALVAEYRLMAARRRANDFALNDPNQNPIPEGPLESISGAHRSGFRVGASFRARGSQWEFGGFYTYFRTDDSRTVTAAPGGALMPTLTRPGLVDAALTATALYRLNYDVYDLEMGRNFLIDNALGLRVVGGARLASIGQDLQGRYDGLSANQTAVDSRADFRGAGLMVGGEAHWTFRWGFSTFGRARAGMLIGDGTARLRETNFAGTVLLTDVSDSFTQVVPVVEMALGVAWKYRRWSTRLGYDATNWFQLVDSPTFVESFRGTAPLSVGKIAHRESNLSLDGFFVQVGVTF